MEIISKYPTFGGGFLMFSGANAFKIYFFENTALSSLKKLLNIKVRKLGVKLAIFWLQCVMLLTFMVTGYSYLSIFLT